MKALILAGKRSHDHHDIAGAFSVSHKCLIPLGGVPMIERVHAALSKSGYFDQIAVSIDDAKVLALLQPFQPETIASKSSVSESVIQGLHELGPPLLVTTADHALLDKKIIEAFLQGARKSRADMLIGFVERKTIEQDYPHNKRTYLRFSDGEYSGANLFLLNSPKAELALEFWKTAEKNRKRPWKIAGSIGFGMLFHYLLRRRTLEETIRKLGHKIGLDAAPVILPYSTAAIDVDKISDFELASEIAAKQQFT